MGTSYQTTLVAAPFDAVVAAATATGLEAILIPAADERVAVLPREGSWEVADLHAPAVALGGRLRCPVLTSIVFDSDLVDCDVYHDGRRAHRYVSDLAMLVEWFEDDDGEFKARLDGTVFPEGAELPSGPLGADPAVFAQFANGAPDLNRIGAALRGDGERVPAEWQHRLIMLSLGLPFEPLTIGYREFNPNAFPAAVVLPSA